MTKISWNFRKISAKFGFKMAETGDGNFYSPIFVLQIFKICLSMYARAFNHALKFYREWDVKAITKFALWADLTSGIIKIISWILFISSNNSHQSVTDFITTIVYYSAQNNGEHHKMNYPWRIWTLLQRTFFRRLFLGILGPILCCNTSRILLGHLQCSNQDGDRDNFHMLMHILFHSFYTSNNLEAKFLDTVQTVNCYSPCLEFPFSELQTDLEVSSALPKLSNCSFKCKISSSSASWNFEHSRNRSKTCLITGNHLPTRSLHFALNSTSFHDTAFPKKSCSSFFPAVPKSSFDL